MKTNFYLVTKQENTSNARKPAVSCCSVVFFKRQNTASARKTFLDIFGIYLEELLTRRSLNEKAGTCAGFYMFLQLEAGQRDEQPSALSSQETL